MLNVNTGSEAPTTRLHSSTALPQIDFFFSYKCPNFTMNGVQFATSFLPYYIINLFIVCATVRNNMLPFMQKKIFFGTCPCKK